MTHGHVHGAPSSQFFQDPGKRTPELTQWSIIFPLADSYLSRLGYMNMDHMDIVCLHLKDGRLKTNWLGIVRGFCSRRSDSLDG